MKALHTTFSKKTATVFSTAQTNSNPPTTAEVLRQLGDGRFETEFKASYETEYGYTRYYIDDEKTYKNAFTENGGFSIPLFDGEEEYDNTKWQVCFMQGEPKWEVNVKTQYDKTDSTIKTLKSKK